MKKLFCLKTILRFVIVFCVVFTLIGCGGETVDPTTVNWRTIQIGNTYVFGAYEQDNNTSNGKEEIEWQVLAKEGTKILVVSKYALDCKPYNASYKSVTWETCTLRKWLNEDFYNTAFSQGEKAKIKETSVSADKNPNYSTNPGNATIDNVFLLSITEVKQYFPNDTASRCAFTAYAKAQGVYTNSSYTVDGKTTCWWWLRSPGNYPICAAGVDYDGSVDYGGKCVNYVYSVRPALWIDLAS